MERMDLYDSDRSIFKPIHFVKILQPRTQGSLEPLFQSSSQKITLAQGVVFVGVFETADISFKC